MKTLENIIFEAVKDQINRIKRSRRFISYGDSDEFSADLDDLRKTIFELSKIDPVSGFEVMLDLLKTHEKVFVRCDDSSGFVADVYFTACQNLGEIGKLKNIDLNDAIDLVFKKTISDQYSIYMYIISDFKDVLGEEGLNNLKTKFLNYKTDDLINKLALEDQKDYDGSWKEKKDFDEFREDASKRIDRTIRYALEQIADCRGDVDEYIRAVAFPKTSYDYNDFYKLDKINIAERLINHNRAKEALEWLDLVETDYESSRSLKLKIKALNLLGRSKDAQQIRTDWFAATLDPEVFDDIIKNSDSDFGDKFTKEAIEKSYKYKSIHTSMNFLTKKKFLSECSNLIQERIKEISGDYYRVERPAANTLKKHGYNLSAALLYRKLAEYVMESSNSKYYKYAVKDIIVCSELDKQIDDYNGFPTHEEFFQDFCERHKKKRSFWAQYFKATGFHPMLKSETD